MIVWLWTFIAGPGASWVAPDAPMIDELTARIEASRSGVDHLSMHFKFKLDYATSGVAIADMASLVVDEESKWSFSTGRFFRDRKSKSASRGKIGEGHVVAAWDGGHSRIVQGNSYSYQTQESTFASDNHLLYYYSWPLGPYAKRDIELRNQHSWLPACLRVGEWKVEGSGSYWVVKRTQPPARLVLDPALNCAVVEKDVQDERGERRRVSFSNFQRIGKSNCFLPTVAQGVFTAKLSGGRTASFPFRFDVLSLNADPVPDSVFKFKPKKGMIVGDNTKRVVYTYQPVDDETLDAASHEIAKLLPAGRGIPEPAGSLWWWVGVASTASIAIGVFLLVRQRWTS